MKSNKKDNKQKKIQDKKVKESSKKTKKTEEEARLVSINEVEKYQIDNPYILTGYRLGFNTPKKILSTLFIWHNESVNVWSHITGVLIFVVLFLYTTIYIAPPGIFSQMAYNIPERWLRDHHNAKERATQIIANGTKQFENSSSYLDQLLQDALQNSLLNQWHEEELHNNHHHPHANLFETIEQYLHNALQVLSHPLTIVEGFDTLKNIVSLIKQVPGEVVNTVDKIITSIQSEETKDSYEHKIMYLYSIISYLNNTVHLWSDEFISKIESENFDWLELKPIIDNPNVVIQYVSRVPLFIHMISAMICLGCSSAYHLFKDLNEQCNHNLARFDYAGISILIAGSNTPPIFYALFCEETTFWRQFYLGLMYTLCISCFVVLMVPRFDQPKYIPLRGFLFIACGLMSSVPIFHIKTYLDTQYLDRFYSTPWAIGGALYIIGALIYVANIPERFFPKRFDYFGSSHNIFHAFIIVAVLVHYQASVNVFHQRQLYQCPVDILKQFAHQ